MTSPSTPKRQSDNDPYGSVSSPSKRSIGGSARHEPIDVDRSSWRKCRDFKEFAKPHSWDPSFVDFQQSRFQKRSKSSDDFQGWIIKFAAEYLQTVKLMFDEDARLAIAWPSWPAKTSGDEHKIVTTCEQLLDISGDVSWEFSHVYKASLRRLLPSSQGEKTEGVQTEPLSQTERDVALAFHVPEKGDRNIAKSLYNEIAARSQEYTFHSYHAPYAPIVGPSGIGKSFCIQQLAAQDLCYVGYLCLAPAASSAYPRRSTVANILQGFMRDRQVTTIFFECYIASVRVHAELCRELGIRPSGFYDLQVKIEFEEWQIRFKDHLEAFINTAMKHLPKSVHGKFDGESSERRKLLTPYAEQHKNTARDFLAKTKEKLVQRPATKCYVGKPNEVTLRDEPELGVVICVDEARYLFQPGTAERGGGESAFLALRRALRHQSVDMSFGKRFFGIVMDTSSRISEFSPPHEREFSPPQERDPSLRTAPPPTKLLSPIYQIHTMDLHADESKTSLYDNIDAASLFRLGRPLWGSLMERRGVTAIFDVAKKIAVGGRNNITSVTDGIDGIALLSYRINFDMTSNSLAEQLIAGYMRYIVDISEDRNLVQTLQPSEPILATASAEITMTDRRNRLCMMRALYAFTTKGLVNPGDTGEMTAAIVLLFAFDQLHGAARDPISLAGAYFLRDFIGTLFPRGIVDEIENLVQHSLPMKELWEKGKVYFTHFARTRSKLDPTKLRESYSRGAALFPCFNAPGCDIIIPVALPHDKWSFVMVQAKNRKADSLTKGKGIRNEALWACRSAANDLPDSSGYLALFMCLRGRDNQDVQEEQGTATVVYSQIPGKPKNKTRQSGNNPVFHSGNHVVMATAGLDPDLFPGMKFRNRETDEESYCTKEIVGYMRDLLNWDSELVSQKRTNYHRGLVPLS